MDEAQVLLAAVLVMLMREVAVPNGLIERARDGEIAIRTRAENGKTVMWAERV